MPKQRLKNAKRTDEELAEGDVLRAVVVRDALHLARFGVCVMLFCQRGREEGNVVLLWSVGRVAFRGGVDGRCFVAVFVVRASNTHSLNKHTHIYIYIQTPNNPEPKNGFSLASALEHCTRSRIHTEVTNKCWWASNTGGRRDTSCG